MRYYTCLLCSVVVRHLAYVCHCVCDENEATYLHTFLVRYLQLPSMGNMFIYVYRDTHIPCIMSYHVIPSYLILCCFVLYITLYCHPSCAHSHSHPHPRSLELAHSLSYILYTYLQPQTNSQSFLFHVGLVCVPRTRRNNYGLGNYLHRKVGELSCSCSSHPTQDSCVLNRLPKACVYLCIYVRRSTNTCLLLSMCDSLLRAFMLDYLLLGHTP